MLHIVWEFHARPERRAEFVEHYGANGSWAKLFRRAPGYRETALAQDHTDPSRFLVVDIWDDLAAFESFKSKFLSDYQELDRRCEDLTILETRIGNFEIL
jgi:heme-degrading monooxygenase HmoA